MKIIPLKFSCEIISVDFNYYSVNIAQNRELNKKKKNEFSDCLLHSDMVRTYV